MFSIIILVCDVYSVHVILTDGNNDGWRYEDVFVKVTFNDYSLTLRDTAV